MIDFDGAKIIATLDDGLRIVRLERVAGAVVAARIGWSKFPGKACTCVRDGSGHTVAMFAQNDHAKPDEAGFPPLKFGFVVPEFERFGPLVERLERACHDRHGEMIKDGPQRGVTGHLFYYRDWLLDRIDGPAVEGRQRNEWFKDGFRHRGGDLPAVVAEFDYANGSRHSQKEWWVEGARHRDGDRPAVEENGRLEWWSNGVRHRGHGDPAVSSDAVSEWWVAGKRHRDGDLPALVTPQERRWYRNGKLHRDDAKPAVEYANGAIEHWVDGVQVGNRFLADWRTVSLALISAIETGADGGFENKRVATARRAAISKRINAVERILLTGDGANSIAGPSPELMDAVCKVCHSDRENWIDTSKFVTDDIKSLRLGAIVAAGRFADLSAADRDALIALLGLMPKGQKWINIVSPGGPGNPPAGTPLDRDALAGLVAGATLNEATVPAVGPVAFAFEWRKREGRVISPHLAATGHAALDYFDESDAPVVATLPTDDGHALDVRLIEGVFYRPVLAPGSFRPLNEVEFRTASASGVAWRDDPFRVKPNPLFCALAVDEIATAKKAGVGNDDAERLEIEAALARAGGIVVVNGMVFRKTSEPVVEIVKTMPRRQYSSHRQEGRPIEDVACWRIAWSFPGDIAQTDCQAVVLTVRDRIADWKAMPWSRGAADADSRRHWGLTLPLHLFEEAETLLSRLASRVIPDKLVQIQLNIPTAETVSLPSQRIEIHSPLAFAATPATHVSQIMHACCALEKIGMGRRPADISFAASHADLDDHANLRKLCDDAVALARQAREFVGRGASLGEIGQTAFEVALLETAAEALGREDYEVDEGLTFGL